MKKRRPKPRNPVARTLHTSTAFHRRVIEDKRKAATTARRAKHRKREVTETDNGSGDV